MKYKYIITIVLTGVVVYMFGAWAKILHKPYADAAITYGFAISGPGIVLLIIKILSGKGRLNR